MKVVIDGDEQKIRKSLFDSQCTIISLKMIEDIKPMVSDDVWH